MKAISIAVFIFVFGQASTAKSPKSQIRGQMEVVDFIKDFSNQFGETILIAPEVRGKVFITQPLPKEKKEQFNLVSMALKINGYTLLQKGQYWVVMSSRNAQRDLIPIYKNELPPILPERMITYIYKFKSSDPTKVVADLRLLTSKDGEMAVDKSSNSIIVSDYTTNVHRIAKILSWSDN